MHIQKGYAVSWASPHEWISLSPLCLVCQSMPFKVHATLYVYNTEKLLSESMLQMQVLNRNAKSDWVKKKISATVSFESTVKSLSGKPLHPHWQRKKSEAKMLNLQ